MKQLPLLGPAFESYNQITWFEFIKSLFTPKSKGGSTTVPGISLSVSNPNQPPRTVIRVSRDPKQVTRDEISVLATEYTQDELTLLQLFRARKIEVIYERDDKRIESDKAVIEQTKKDARARTTSKRKVKSTDKLQLAGHDTHVPTESSVLDRTESEE